MSVCSWPAVGGRESLSIRRSYRTVTLTANFGRGGGEVRRIRSLQGLSTISSADEGTVGVPTPRNITEVMTFFGLVKQVSTFMDDLLRCWDHSRPLLGARNEFAWNGEHQRAFNAVRRALSSVPTLVFYDPRRPTKA